MALGYLDRRDLSIDTTEWVDICCAIKAVAPRPRGLTFVELGAGKGRLLAWLEARLPGNRFVGVDLEGWKYNPRVARADLNDEDPPPGDVYVFQHVLEHLRQDRAVELLRCCLHRGLAVVGVLPGHFTGDPTHVVDHYELEDVRRLIEAAGPPHWLVRPDTRSFIDPAARDWLVVLSRRPIDARRAWPRGLRAALLILRCAASLHAPKRGWPA